MAAKAKGAQKSKDPRFATNWKASKGTRKPGRGGRRPGAGRPRGKVAKPPPEKVEPIEGADGATWNQVRAYSRANATREQIVAGLAIPAAVLEQPDVMNRLQSEIDRGRALYQLDLLQALHYSGIRELSVMTLLAAARETLRWDKHERQVDREPDDDAALAELDAVVKALAQPPKPPKKDS